MQALARTHTAEAVQTLVDIMRIGKPDRARAAAAELLLDRGWGRAPQTVDVFTENQESLLSHYTEEDLVIRTVHTFPEIAQKAFEQMNFGRD